MLSSMRFPVLCLVPLLIATNLALGDVVRNGLRGEWLGDAGISRAGDFPLVLEANDTWEDTVAKAKLTVKDTDEAQDLQVVEATTGATSAVSLTGITPNARLEGVAFIAKDGNAEAQPVTFEFWYRNGDLSKDVTLFETGGTAYGSSLTIGDGGIVGDDGEDQLERRDDLRFRLGGGSSAASASVTVDLPNSADTEFVHIVAVYGGNGSHVYINGSLAGSGTPSNKIKWQGGNTAALLGQAGGATGGGGGAGDLPFVGDNDGAGSVSVFRWYGRGLSTAEVAINYLSDVGMPLADKVFAHWKLDDAVDATTALDVKGAVDLTVTGAVAGGEGIIGGAFSFDGDGDHLTKVLDVNKTHDMFAVTIWAKAVAANQPNFTSVFNSGSSGKDFQLDINASKYRFLGDSDQANFGNVTTEWMHLAVVHSGTVATLYMDGSKVKTVNTTDNVFQRYQIGINRGQSETFEGLLDDVGLWGYPLTDQEIAAIQGLGRLSGVSLEDPAIQAALDLQPGGRITDVGPDKHSWAHVAGLAGAVGSVTGSINGGDARLVLRADGTGIRYDGKAGEVPVIVSYQFNPALHDVGLDTEPNLPATIGLPTGFSISGGALPAGLEFDATTGGVTGTPTAVTEETTIAIIATNANGDSEPFDLKVAVSDLSPPVITLTGSSKILQKMGEDFTDPGSTVLDNVDTGLTITVTGEVDTSKTGIYMLTYTVADAAGNEAVAVTRQVSVEDVHPIISPIGDVPTVHEQPKTFDTDPGAEVATFPHAPLAYYAFSGNALDTSRYANGYHGTLRGDATFSSETAPAGKRALIDGDAANDDAYGDTWDDASDGGGDGLNGWKLTANPAGGAAGFFFGDSKVGSGDINTADRSFGLYGNGDGAAAANADRTFAAPLADGQSFSIQLAVDYRTGAKGIDLDDAEGNSLWNFNVGKNVLTDLEDYSYADLANGVDATTLGLDYQPDSVFTLTIAGIGGTRVAITLARESAANGRETPLNAVEVDLGSALAGFGLYCAGTEAGDRSNLYANNLTLWGPGTGVGIGNSLALDGAGDFVEVTNWKGITASNPRTISAWIKTGIQNNSSRYDMAIASWGQDASRKKWIFRTQKSNGLHGTIRVEVNGGAIVGSSHVTDDQWHHVAVVLPDGATLVEELQLYVDGQKEAISYSSTNVAIDTAASTNVMIGKDHSNRHFQGNIDNVAIFDLALSSEQILEVYEATPPVATMDLSAVTPETPGEYLVSYSATDATGSTGTGTRTVQVIDVTPPVITIADETVTLQVGQVWNPHEGVTSTDNTDGALTPASSADVPSPGRRLHIAADHLPGLVHGDPVAEWQDLSGLGHHLTQADVSLRPRLDTGLVITGGTLVADSIAEYSGTQGKEGWRYGYFEGAEPFDFTRFTEFIGGSGNGPWTGVTQHWTGDADDGMGNWDLLVTPGGPPWTMISQTISHPQGIIAGVVGVPQMAVRRWVSDLEDSVGLTGHFHNTSAVGDGTNNRIFLNGSEIYSSLSDGVRLDFNLIINVKVGDNIDFVTDWGNAEDSGSDGTELSVQVFQDPTTTSAPFPSVRFAGGTFLQRADALAFTGSPRISCFIVTHPTANGRLVHLGENTGAAGKTIAFMSDSSFRYNNGNKIYFNDNLYNSWNVGSFLVDTSKGYNDGVFYRNGVVATETDGATATLTMQIPEEGTETLLGMGRSTAGGPQDLVTGNISEVILFDDLSDDPTRNAVHYYFSQKYGMNTGATPDNLATTFDTSVTGTYTVKYYSKDAAGNLATASRTVVIEGNNPPVITVLGDDPLKIPLGGEFTDPGVKATDVEDGDLTQVVLSESQLLDVNKLGTYGVIYTVVDSAGGTASAGRTVIVADMTAPVVTLIGEAEVTIAVGTSYTEAGIDASDNVTDGETLTASLNHLTSDGLVLHLDAAQIQGLQDLATLDVWEDSSGNSNHATQILVDSQPTFIADTGSGKPAVRFDGQSDFLTIRSVLVGGLSGRTVFVVTSAQNTGNVSLVNLNSDHVHNASKTAYTYMFTPEIGIRINGNKMFANDKLTLDEPTILGVGNPEEGILNDIKVWKNGLELTDMTGGGGTQQLDIAGEHSSIGGRNGANFTKGDIMEILVYNRFLDPDEVRLLQLHLQSKHTIDGSASLVDTETLGTQSVHYFVRDDAGNIGTAKRVVNVVVDDWTPVITLGGNPQTDVVVGVDYVDSGVTALDKQDGDLTESITLEIKDSSGAVLESVDTTVVGSIYTLSYSVTDLDGHTGTAVRTVTVIGGDSLPPVITLNGEALIIVPVGRDYTDAGATALDNVDGTIEPVATSTVDTSKVGTYAVTYNVSDAADNAATAVSRTVVVEDWSPVLSVIGDNPLSFDQNTEFQDPGGEAINLPFNPVLYLPFNGNALDHSAKLGNQDADLRGDAKFVASRHADSHALALDLDGTGDSAVITEYKGIIGQGGHTVSLWLKGLPQFADDGTTRKTTELVHWGDGRTGTKRYTLRVNNTANFNEFRVDVNGAYVYGSTNIVDDQWHHVAVVHAANSPLGAVTLYVDGKAEISTTPGGGEINTILDTLSRDDFRIGNAFKGQIDDVLLFDRALTAEQVAALHSAVPVAVEVDSSALKSEEPGSYLIQYSASNDYGTATASRQVVVQDALPPVITLLNGEAVPTKLGEPFTDPGATAIDNVDGEVPVSSSLGFPSTGLIAHWKLDEDAEATSVNDSSANEINGTPAGGTTLGQDGKREKAISFDGKDGALSFGDIAAMDSPSSFTFSSWFNRRAEVATATNHAVNNILAGQSSATSNDNFEVGTEGSQVEIYIDAGEVDTTLQVEAGIQNETWHHIVVTYDVADSEGKALRLYVDNQLVQAWDQFKAKLDSSDTSPFSLGLARPSDEKWGQFDGLQDDTALWNRALSPTEIQTLHTNGILDTSAKGSHTITYTATDVAGNTSTATRTIVVTDDLVAPVITLVGEAEVTIEVGQAYDDEGVTATDEVDGNLTPFIDDGGTLDAVDINTPGTYIITYDVKDLSGNSAVQVTRKVIVQSGNPVDLWIVSSGLAGLPEADRALDADPDADTLPNLLEYALGGDPVKADQTTAMPTVDFSSGKFVITYIRLKGSVDASLTYKAQLSTSLGDATSWSDSALSLKGALEGISQADLPDEKPFAESSYERVEATANTAMADEAAGRQFLRLLVEQN